MLSHFKIPGAVAVCVLGLGAQAQAGDEPEASLAERAQDSLAQAQLQGEGHFLFRHNVLDAPDWSLDDDELLDDHSEFIHRLYLNHFQGPLSIGLQLDAGLVTPRDRIYLDPARIDGLAEWQLVSLTRLQLRYESDYLVLEGGDFYSVVGQGGTLQLSRAPAIDLDVALRGARATIRSPWVEATAFMGKMNPQQLTLVAQNIDPARVFPPYSEPDDPSLVQAYPEDVVWGTTLSAASNFVSGGLGTTGLSFDPTLIYGAEDIAKRVTDLRSYAAWVQGTTPFALDLYGEANAFSYRLDEDAFNAYYTLPEQREGGGFLGDYRGSLYYASAVYGWGPWTLLAEGKRSRDNQHFNIRAGGLRGYAFATPPSLEYERAVVEDSGYTLVSNDLSVAHLRLDRSIGTGWQLRLDYSNITDHSPGYFSGVPERIVHVLGGVDYFSPSGVHVTLVAGRRRGVNCDEVDYVELAGASAPCEMADLDGGERLSLYFAQGLPRHNDILWHTDGEVALPMGLDFSWSLVHFSELREAATWFYQWQSAISYHPTERMAASVYLDMSNNGLFLDQRLDESGNLLNDQIIVGQWWSDTEVLPGEPVPTKAHGAIELAFRPTPSQSVKLFYGSIMGGIRCAGGQCRPLPAFSGMRAEYQYRF